MNIDQEEDENYDDNENEMESSIQIIRLITGEDIVTEVVEILDDESPELNHLVMLDPFRVIYTIDREQNGKLIIQLVPWMYRSMVSVQMYKVMLHNVLTCVEPAEGLFNYYMEIVEKTERREERKKMKDVTSTLTVEQEIERQDDLEKHVGSNKELASFVNSSIKRIKRKTTTTKKPASRNTGKR